MNRYQNLYKRKPIQKIITFMHDDYSESTWDKMRSLVKDGYSLKEAISHTNAYNYSHNRKPVSAKMVREIKNIYFKGKRRYA